MYHGPPFRSLEAFAFQYDGGWGKLVARPLAAWAGPRPRTGWVLPAALLDGCLVACGAFVYFQFGGRLEVPQGFARIRLGRSPRQGETCVQRFYFRGQEGRHSRFDFALFGSHGDVILAVEDYRTVLVGQPAEKQPVRRPR